MINENFRSVVLLTLGLAAAVAGQAAPAPLPPALAPVPPVEEISTECLDQAVRASLSAAAETLLVRARTNDLGLVWEPINKRHPVITRYETKTVRALEYRYETYYTYEYQKGLSATDAGKTTKVAKQRAIPTGKTQSVETVVASTNGPICRTNIAENVWQSGFLGQNALALYALLESGIPASDETLNRLATTLDNYLTAYGLPDTTWDLAWLAASFSRLGSPAFSNTLERVTNKLLEGQITDGAARGLWGPVCINREVLAALMAYDSTLAAELAKCKASLAKTPEAAFKQRKVEEVEGAIRDLQAFYADVAQLGLRFDNVIYDYLLPPLSPMPDMEYPVYIRGLPYYFYNQAVADLESTALALFALREAAKCGALPRETKRPELAKGRFIAPPQETFAILARAAAALAGLQKNDGAWDEANINQPSGEFRALPMGKNPLMTKEPVYKLDLRRSLCSTAQGAGALVNAGLCIGMEKLLNRYGTNLAVGQNLRRKLAEAYLEGNTNGLPIGGMAEPYDLCLAFVGVERLGGRPEADRRDLWERLAYRLVNMQSTNGTWGAGTRCVFFSSGIKARQHLVFQQEHAEKQKALPEKDRKPFGFADSWGRYYWSSYNNCDTARLATPYAMIVLAKGLKQPEAGNAAASTNAPPSLPDLMKLRLAMKKPPAPVPAPAAAPTPAPEPAAGLETKPATNLASEASSPPDAVTPDAELPPPPVLQRRARQPDEVL